MNLYATCVKFYERKKTGQKLNQKKMIVKNNLYF